MLLVVEEGVWRDVEEVKVGDVVRGFSEWALVWGDVDPHGGGLGAGEPDGSTVEKVAVMDCDWKYSITACREGIRRLYCNGYEANAGLEFVHVSGLVSRPQQGGAFIRYAKTSIFNILQA
jgi:hypothetical protein